MTFLHRIVLFAITVFLFSASFCAANNAIKKWMVRAYWEQLVLGMTDEVVLELLGEPDDRERTATGLIWYYSESPERQEDRVIKRPRHGFVRFRLSNEGKSALLGWAEPDWTTIPPRTERQYLADLQRRESEIKTEESMRRVEEQRQQRQAELERLQAERQAQQQQRALEAEQRRVEQESLRRESLDQRQTQGAKSQTEPGPYSLRNIRSRYWFIVSGGCVIMALLISITYGYKRY